MLNLFLFRHAKAIQSSLTIDDYNRPLHQKGILQLEHILDRFKNHTISGPVLISSAKRTRLTYQKISPIFHSPPTYIDELYLASKETIDTLIRTTQNCDNLSIIGHNDGLSDLACFYTEEYIHMPTGSFIHLQFDLESWELLSQGTATIVSFFQPIAH